MTDKKITERLDRIEWAIMAIIVRSLETIGQNEAKYIADILLGEKPIPKSK